MMSFTVTRLPGVAATRFAPGAAPPAMRLSRTDGPCSRRLRGRAILLWLGQQFGERVDRDHDAMSDTDVPQPPGAALLANQPGTDSHRARSLCHRVGHSIGCCMDPPQSHWGLTRQTAGPLMCIAYDHKEFGAVLWQTADFALIHRRLTIRWVRVFVLDMPTITPPRRRASGCDNTPPAGSATGPRHRAGCPSWNAPAIAHWT